MSAARPFTDPRFSRRRKMVRRSRRRRMLWRAAGAAAVALVVWGVFFSPLLAVRRVRVTGARHVTARAVARVTGLDSSDNLLLISPSSIAAQAAKLAWVKSVEVERRLPGTVRLRVTESKPVLILSAGGREWMLDARGRLLGPRRAAPGLPVITGSPVGDLERGAKIDSEEVTGALAVFRSMGPLLRRRIATIFAPTTERLTLSLKDGGQVRYGAAEALASKNEVLRVLLRRARTEDLTVAYIDVRVPTTPALARGVPSVPAPAWAPAP
jgi:cell division protein FtsQ